MYCGKCGRQVETESKYCPFCGEKLCMEDKSAEKGKNRRKTIWMAVVYGIICVAGVAGYFLLSGGGKKDTTENGTMKKQDISDITAPEGGEEAADGTLEEDISEAAMETEGEKKTVIVELPVKVVKQRTEGPKQDEQYSYEDEYTYEVYDIVDNLIYCKCTFTTTEMPDVKNITDFIWTYDENGNCIKEQRYEESGDLLSEWEWVYEGDQLKQAVYVDPNDEEGNEEYDYFYDGMGRLIEALHILGEQIYVTSYAYDEEGNLLYGKRADTRGNMIDKVEFECDSNRNILQSIYYRYENGVEKISFADTFEAGGDSALFYDSRNGENFYYPVSSVRYNVHGELIHKCESRYISEKYELYMSEKNGNKDGEESESGKKEKVITISLPVETVDGSLKIEYTFEDSIVYRTVYDQRGEVVTKTTGIYDREGRTISSQSYDEGIKDMGRTEIIYEDEKRKYIFYYCEEEGHEICMVSTYYYDSNGIISREEQYKNGEKSSVSYFECDAEGNILKSYAYGYLEDGDTYLSAILTYDVNSKEIVSSRIYQKDGTYREFEYPQYQYIYKDFEICIPE